MQSLFCTGSSLLCWLSLCCCYWHPWHFQVHFNSPIPISGDGGAAASPPVHPHHPLPPSSTQTRPANSALVSLWGSAKKILYLLFSHIHQHRIRFLSNIEKYLWHAFHTPCYTYSWGQQRLCLIHQCDGYILIFSIAVDDQPLLHLVTRWVEQMHGGVIRLQNVGHSTAPFCGGKGFSFSLSPQHYGHILAQTKQSKQ